MSYDATPPVASCQSAIPPFRSLEEIQRFLKAIHGDFLSTVDVVESGLLDILFQYEVLTETDIEACGSNLPTRKQKARKLWTILNHIDYSKFNHKVLPILIEKYSHIIPTAFCTTADSSSRSEKGVTEECTRCNIICRIPAETFMDTLYKLNAIDLKIYSSMNKTSRFKSSDWTFLFNALAIHSQQNRAGCQQEMTKLLQRHCVRLPADLKKLIAQGFKCTCTSNHGRERDTVSKAKMSETPLNTVPATDAKTSSGETVSANLDRVQNPMAKRRLDIWLKGRRLSRDSTASQESTSTLYPESENESTTVDSVDTESLSSHSHQSSICAQSLLPSDPEVLLYLVDGRNQNPKSLPQVSSVRFKNSRRKRPSILTVWRCDEGLERPEVSHEVDLNEKFTHSVTQLAKLSTFERNDDRHEAGSIETFAEGSDIEDTIDRIFRVTLFARADPDCTAMNVSAFNSAKTEPQADFHKQTQPQADLQSRLDRRLKPSQPSGTASTKPYHTFPQSSTKVRKRVCSWDLSSGANSSSPLSSNTPPVQTNENDECFNRGEDPDQEAASGLSLIKESAFADFNNDLVTILNHAALTARLNVDLQEFRSFVTTHVTSAEQLKQFLKKAVICDVRTRDVLWQDINKYNEAERCYVAEIHHFLQKSLRVSGEDDMNCTAAEPANLQAFRGKICQLCWKVSELCEDLLIFTRIFLLSAIYLNTSNRLTTADWRAKVDILSRDVMVLLELTHLEARQNVSLLDELQMQLPRSELSSQLHQLLLSLKFFLEST